MQLRTDANDMKHPYRSGFLAAFVLFLISVLPILIRSGGVYLYYSDFNTQTMPFTEHLSALLHGGGFPVFDWQSGLGLDFLTGYGGYLFSPFSLMLIVLPTAAIPYVFSVAVALKMGISAASAALYCRQYVEKNRTAFLCGMLYAFSGFQLANLYFPFIDTICLFPLLLYCFDRLVTDKKPLCFALMLGLHGYINSVLLFAECVFIAIYFIVRTAAKQFPKLTVRSFFRYFTECAAGIGLAASLLLPTAFQLAGNQRAGYLIFDRNLLAYESVGVIWHIVQSMLMPPELIHSGWYFTDEFLSLSIPVLYIPLFTVIGAAAVLREDKRAWYSILTVVCAVFACIPVLNSSFSMFNASYYSRWFFCPVLILVMITGKYIERMDRCDVTKEYCAVAAVSGVFVLLGIYTLWIQTESKRTVKTLWAMACAEVFLGMVILYLLRHPQPSFKWISQKNLPQIVCVCCAMPFVMQHFAISMIDLGEYVPYSKMQMWNDMQPVEIADDSFFRIVSENRNYPNVGLNWGYPSVLLFNSMILRSESDFYHYTGGERQQHNEYERTTEYPLSSFLSVKYDLYFNKPLTGGVVIEPEDAVQGGNYNCVGFNDYEVSGWYMVFTNDAYIPMGYTFDYYLPLSELPAQHLSDKQRTAREKLLLKAIWLDDDQIERYGNLLEPLPEALKKDISDEAYFADCAARAASACERFEPRSDGFDAEITLEKENLVFFSVPYSESFTACVDGAECRIEKVFGGLCAVPVSAGTHAISFSYRTRGLREGISISLASAAVLLIYGAAAWAVRRKQQQTASAETQ